ncbi:MAG: sulfite exporter TauE/SafE family protein, partial [Pseudomonadota bacterium]
MQIYLPVAEIAVNMFTLVGMGAAVGFLAGMFGVGGGFLITPLLIFLGISPAVAVATGANQVIAASVSGAIAHLRRGTVDIPLGMVLLAGGIAGALVGVGLFRLLLEAGYADAAVSLSYVVFLGIVGGLMLFESLKTLHNRFRGVNVPAKAPRSFKALQSLPLKAKFKRSKLYVSVIPVLILGAAVGILASIMGVGGGFIMVPAMIYLLRVPTTVVIGTSLFQIVFVAAVTTILHAVANQTVDVILALLLMVGGVICAQIGARAGQRLRAD